MKLHPRIRSRDVRRNASGKVASRHIELGGNELGKKRSGFVLRILDVQDLDYLRFAIGDSPDREHVYWPLAGMSVPVANGRGSWTPEVALYVGVNDRFAIDRHYLRARNKRPTVAIVKFQA